MPVNPKVEEDPDMTTTTAVTTEARRKVLRLLVPVVSPSVRPGGPVRGPSVEGCGSVPGRTDPLSLPLPLVSQPCQ